MLLEAATALICLSHAIFFEARDQPSIGQIAVGQVILTRVADHRYPNSVCEVVTEGYYYSWNPKIPIPDQCQFSFWCDGKDEEIMDKEAYEWAEDIAFGLLEGTLNHIDVTDGATHYHAHYVQPSWKDMMTKTVRINDHIFYRLEMP